MTDETTAWEIVDKFDYTNDDGSASLSSFERKEMFEAILSALKAKGRENLCQASSETAAISSSLQASPSALQSGVDFSAFNATVEWIENPDILEIKFPDNISGCRIKPDGAFETWGNYAPDVAAQAFWSSVIAWPGGICSFETLRNLFPAASSSAPSLPLQSNTEPAAEDIWKLTPSEQMQYLECRVRDLTADNDRYQADLLSSRARIYELTSLRPMADAPKDRETIVWLKFKDDMAPYNGRTDDPNWHQRWQGRWMPGRHEGHTRNGYDMGWSIALPVGHGGLPDDWFEGWLPLPPAAKPTEAQLKRSPKGEDDAVPAAGPSPDTNFADGEHR